MLGLYPEKIDKKETGHKWLPALLKVAKVAKQVASEGGFYPRGRHRISYRKDPLRIDDSVVIDEEALSRIGSGVGRLSGVSVAPYSLYQTPPASSSI